MSNPFPSGRSAIYRLHDATGTLLYVGISHAPKARLKEHAGDKLWWHLVAREEITWCSSRAEALAAEAKAVNEERPLYNGYHQFGKGQPPRARRYDDTADQAAVRDGVRAALNDGTYTPGMRLQGALVGRHFGASPTTAHHALGELARGGLLDKGDRCFIVPSGC
ncbi:GIY-YIG nuclease family protein [Streptomyces sp. SAS_275]|uniref:GIY-YIG nuclease family protein n=1 Tax=Streptomyces sp. SAS_275 TaxID=3412746 RepID=UPI00403D10F9